MDPAAEDDELTAAWRALEGADATPGWRTIPVALGSAFTTLAARRFPENEEALLVAFDSSRSVGPRALPQGMGFQVTELHGIGGRDCLWIGLSRHSAGKRDLFARMVRDVVSTLGELPASSTLSGLECFLARIRAWQDFMRNNERGLLDREEELGLFGELLVLEAILDAGLNPTTALLSWRGPAGGLHDFAFQGGAIEVKSTSAADGFAARIGSLDQLDDREVAPLFLTGIRLRADPAGETLPRRIGRVRERLASSPEARILFDSALLHVGYLDTQEGLFTHAFSHASTRVLPVLGDFPRLTRATVPSQVRSARYELDLDLIHGEELGIREALQQLGVIS